MAEPPQITGEPFAADGNKRGWIAAAPAVVYTPTFTHPTSAIDPDDFDWTKLSTATALVAAVKERYLAATFGASSIADPTAGSEDAQKASYWASLQSAIIDAVQSAVSDGNNSAANDFQSWETAGGSRSEAFRLFCVDAGLTDPDGSWGWSYATAIDPATNAPKVVRPSSTRLCATNDYYGLKPMVQDILDALNHLVRFRVPSAAWSSAGASAGSTGDAYSDDHWDGTKQKVGETQDVVANHISQDADAGGTPTQTIRADTETSITSDDGIVRVRLRTEAREGVVLFTPPVSGSYDLHAKVVAPTATTFDYYPDSAVSEGDWITIETGAAVSAGTATTTQAFGESDIAQTDLDNHPPAFPDVPASPVVVAISPSSVSGDEPLDVDLSATITVGSTDIHANTYLAIQWDLDGSNGSTTTDEHYDDLAAGSYTSTCTARQWAGKDYEVQSQSSAAISVSTTTTTTTTSDSGSDTSDTSA